MNKAMKLIKIGAIMVGASLGLIISGLITLCMYDAIAYALNAPIL